MSNEAMRQALESARRYADARVMASKGRAEEGEVEAAWYDLKESFRAAALLSSDAKPAQQEVPPLLQKSFRELVAERKASTSDQQAKEAEPSAEQMKQLLDGLGRCHVAASRYEFLRTWIRDWTDHKLQSHREAPTKKDAALKACVDAVLRQHNAAEELADRIMEMQDVLEQSATVMQRAYDCMNPAKFGVLVDDLKAAITQAQEALK